MRSETDQWEEIEKNKKKRSRENVNNREEWREEK